MLIVNFVIVVVFFVLAILSTVASGFVSWHLLLTAGDKVAGETILYLTIIVSVVLLLVLLLILQRSYKRTHAVEKMIDFARINGAVDKGCFDNLGGLGFELKTLYSEIENISQKRAYRLFFMDSLINTVFDEMNEKMVVLDLQGNILYVWRKAFQKKEAQLFFKIGMPITELYPDFDFTNATSQAALKHIAVTVLVKAGVQAVCVPILGYDNTVDGYLLLLDKIESASVVVEHIFDKFKTSEKQKRLFRR